VLRAACDTYRGAIRIIQKVFDEDRDPNDTVKKLRER
jgi:hypothetical protein